MADVEVPVLVLVHEPDVRFDADTAGLQSGK